MTDERLDPRTRDRIRLLVDSRNHAIVSILEEAGEPVHVRELAERLVTRDLAVATTAEYDERVDRTVVSLHHDRLPKLAEADLVEYDTETNVVTYRPSASSDVEWQDEVLSVLGTHLGTDDAAAGEAIGVIEGRDAILRHGRRLADEAAEELFCIYLDTDLLEDECVRRARKALDRGVRLSVGSGDAGIRELARRRLPEATVWTPRLDWMNTATYPRLGRLVMADRRTVMLGVLDQPGGDGSEAAETAVVGEGLDNPLVVFVRELLGPRLDHLDYQSEDFGHRLHP